jgi:hypothetical protein
MASKEDEQPELADVLNDLELRFILNLPEEELNSADRLFFQLEQAHWFYEDFYADMCVLFCDMWWLFVPRGVRCFHASPVRVVVMKQVSQPPAPPAAHIRAAHVQPLRVPGAA